MELENNEMMIGQKIKEVFDNSEIKIGDFAEKLGMVRQNVYRIFERTHIDTGLLIKISELLNHDFFQYYTRPSIIETPVLAEMQNGNGAASSDQAEYSRLANELEKTKMELELANKEIMYLKKIIDLMEERAKWISAKS